MEHHDRLGSGLPPIPVRENTEFKPPPRERLRNCVFRGFSQSTHINTEMIGKASPRLLLFIIFQFVFH